MRMTVHTGRLAATKPASNVSLRSGLIEEARQLDINVSEACERGLSVEVARARRERWLAENRAAIEASNAYVEKHGLPLARYRLF